MKPGIVAVKIRKGQIASEIAGDVPKVPLDCYCLTSLSGEPQVKIKSENCKQKPVAKNVKRSSHPLSKLLFRVSV